MSLIKFVHAADLHLDSPFVGIRSMENMDDGIASVLAEATFRAYDNIIDLCIRERVDALFVAGDVFDGADRSLKAQRKFGAGLLRLDEAGIRSFVCHGNHDPLDGWESRLDLPPSCHRFGPQVEHVPVFPEAPDSVVVHGISYPQREVRENLIPAFEKAGPGPFNIGLIHANVDNNTAHDPYAPCSLSDLVETGYDYWALGHVHTRQILRKSDPAVVYPGNPQGRHVNESGARGVYVVDVTDTRDVHMEFRPVDVVRWGSAEISIAELETEQQLLDAIDDRLAALQSEADDRHLVVRLSLAGSGGLHSTLMRPDFTEHLLEDVNLRWKSRSPFIWCERIEHSTTPIFDREKRALGSDFVADLLRLSDAVRVDQTALGEMNGILDELYSGGNSGRYLRGNAPTMEEMNELVAEAEALCLAELMEEETE